MCKSRAVADMPDLAAAASAGVAGTGLIVLVGAGIGAVIRVEDILEEVEVFLERELRGRTERRRLVICGL